MTHSPINLPDEVLKRIAAEEMARFKIQQTFKVEQDDGSGSRLLKFLNSALGLFILSAVFISGFGGLFTWLTQRVREDEAQRASEKKLFAEFEWRLIELDARIAEISETDDADAKGVATAMVYRAAFGAVEFQPALPEFKNENWAGMIIQLDDDVGPPPDANEALAAVRDLQTTTPKNFAGVGGKNGLGFFPVGYLEARSKTLHQYRDSVRPKIFNF